MQGLAGQSQEGLADALGQRRVGMDQRGDLGGYGLPRDREHRLGDQVGDVGPHHVDAEHRAFLGGDDPYEKLKRALRAEVDEAEWAKLYSAKSIPFDPPRRGKIAIKVINHYGDEVLKVFKV